uniref:Uncharacterized protein n=1 Tax=Anas zonorhyncha TaxID=75864 RepID=A0A8B9UCQ1_9AVES
MNTSGINVYHKNVFHYSNSTAHVQLVNYMLSLFPPPLIASCRPSSLFSSIVCILKFFIHVLF